MVASDSFSQAGSVFDETRLGAERAGPQLLECFARGLVGDTAQVDERLAVAFGQLLYPVFGLLLGEQLLNLAVALADPGAACVGQSSFGFTNRLQCSGKQKFGRGVKPFERCVWIFEIQGQVVLRNAQRIFAANNRAALASVTARAAVNSW